MKRRVISLVLTVVLLAALFVAPVGASAATKIKILKVTEDGARLRRGPSSSYDVIKSLSKGAKVFYAGKTKKSFAYICTSTGTKGYVFQGFLKNYGSCYKSQVYYAKKRAKVYKKAGSSSRVTTLSKKQHVIVYQVKGKWAYVKTMGGKGGYVKASVLKKAF